jgi:hypothetical protein
MKKALLTLALLASVFSSHAQGIITFFSLNEIRSACVPNMAGFTAGLFLASDVNTPIGTTDFVPGTGYLNAVDVTVPGFGVGSSPIFVVRIWETGKTFATSTARAEHPFHSRPSWRPSAPESAGHASRLGGELRLWASRLSRTLDLRPRSFRSCRPNPNAPSHVIVSVVRG